MIETKFAVLIFIFIFSKIFFKHSSSSLKGVYQEEKTLFSFFLSHEGI